MRNTYILFLKNTVIILIVVFLCLFSFANSANCLASENAISDIATGGNAINSSVSDAEAEKNQSSATSCESEGYISVRVTETPLWDSLISGLSCFLSIVALILSFRSYKETSSFAAQNLNLQKEQHDENLSLQKQHNRDEVKPFVTIGFSTEPFFIEIKNHGLGPAILTSMEWVNTETNKKEDTLNRLVEDVFRKMKHQNVANVQIRWEDKPILNNKYDKDVLATEETRYLIRILGELGESNEIAKSMVAESLRYMRVVIEYTDIYSSDTWKIQKDCTWFANRVNDVNLDEKLDKR